MAVLKEYESSLKKSDLDKFINYWQCKVDQYTDAYKENEATLGNDEAINKLIQSLVRINKILNEANEVKRVYLENIDFVQPVHQHINNLNNNIDDLANGAGAFANDVHENGRVQELPPLGARNNEPPAPERFKKYYSGWSARNEARTPAVYSETRVAKHRSDAAMRGYRIFENSLN